MKKENCDYVQEILIDNPTQKELGFFDRAKLLFHTNTCPDCKEYKNKSNLLTKFLFSSNDNSERKNSYQGRILHKSNFIQNRLASFPEQNPSPILEIEKSGKISYQNPAFFNHFPHISEINVEHEFLKDLKFKFKDLVDGKIKEYSKEIHYNGVHYIKRATYLKELQVVRIFYLDVTEQKNYEKIISEKNKEITDSIKYAKRIQDAILPSNSNFISKFPHSFVLFNPKDIVAGDFYWLLEVEDWIYVAAADCTGHGVPGALVSVVCNNALNRSIKEFGERETGKILDKTRELVLETFANNDSDVKDGMDISLIGYNIKNKEIFWSGANNPLWYFESNQFHEIKAHKQSIGKSDTPTPFKTHKIDLQKGNYLFLFTDGYADQFGGIKNKKITYKKMQETITLNIHKSPKEIKDILSAEFQSWKGQHEQTDDVLVIGIKLQL